MTRTPGTTPQENILAEWMGDYAYLDTHALYLQFGTLGLPLVLYVLVRHPLSSAQKRV